MFDQIVGLALVAVAVVIVVAVVATAAVGRERAALHPPPGIHVPPGSWLPMAWAVAGGLIGAGLAFKPDDQPVNWWFFVPGLIVVVVSAVLSVRAASREWRDTERGPHDEGAAH